MIEDNNFKCMKAIRTLKPNTECVIRHPIDNEVNFNKIEWVTGTDDTGVLLQPQQIRIVN